MIVEISIVNGEDVNTLLLGSCINDQEVRVTIKEASENGFALSATVSIEELKHALRKLTTK